jgi:hypothetical protein
MVMVLYCSLSNLIIIIVCFDVLIAHFDYLCNGFLNVLKAKFDHQCCGGAPRVSLLCLIVLVKWCFNALHQI